MDSAESTGTAEASGNATGSNAGGWETIIKNIMVKIETVSSHFSYKEEYVLDHSPEWIDRKYWQAMKEKFENSQARVIDGFKSLALLADSIFNKGANYNLFIFDSFEDALKQQSEEKVDSNFIPGQWWMNETRQVKSSE